MGQSSPVLALMCSKAPSINLPNFVNFVDGVTAKTVNAKIIPGCHVSVYGT